jgi:ABC-2 type transport system permease protein
MRNIWTIASREFKGYFISPLAYVVAASILLILGAFFSAYIFVGFQTGDLSPDGRRVIGTLVVILLFAIPAITMRQLADEQRLGTMELLLTSPVRDWELIIGKWLAAFGFISGILLLTWVYPWVIHQLTEPGIDQGILISAYVGLLLLQGAMLAVGLFASSLFRSPVAAFFVGVAFLMLMWVMGYLGGGASQASQVMGYLGLQTHYYNTFYRGILDLSDVVYYLSVIALGLFLSIQVLESRRWR